ncbi:nitrogen regulatory protein GLN3-like [Selaginella moellendorffii]|uniref:nitrogen regulatory protein GLN3-like n=1 Tax=Selaginella moellendorffii TaxID=88036 RepID=UPI000D1C9FD5|nr:nitrogen regulatory protein GLN3-like [Selaginella moellendorffii]|eukprot:XP_024522778.1 nitrogen regulatory protein GLN3-like [Selaginella moellendorffii]
MMEVASTFVDKSQQQQQQESGAAKRAAAVTAWEPETGSILDPFHIEDLLDFSNEDIAGPIGEEVHHQNSIAAASAAPIAPPAAQQHHHHHQHHHGIEQQPSNEFPIDCDEMPELEWLSSLVDDDTFTNMGDELHKSMFIGSKGSSFASSSIINSSAATNTTTTNKRNIDSLLLLDDITTTTTTTTIATTGSKDKFQVGSPISVLESSSATSGRLAAAKDLSVPGRPRSKRLRSSSTWNTSSSSLINPGSSSSSGGGGGGGVVGGGGEAIMIINTTTGNNVTSFSSSPATSSISDKDLASSDEQDAVESSTIKPDTITAGGSTSSATSPSSSSASSLCNTNKTSIAAVATGKPPLGSSIIASTNGPAAGGGMTIGGVEVQPRRCTHCLSQKTPQWRAGPEGPKTLCNACGVRFKSGRLFPEYRPALSPTFLSEVHSNSHRKVLEMRRQKESSHPRFLGPSPRSPSLSPSSSSAPAPTGGEVLDGGLIYNVVQS